MKPILDVVGTVNTPGMWYAAVAVGQTAFGLFSRPMTEPVP
jgi:hypothetical protein